MLRELKSISSEQLFTLWWSKRWVRGFVIILIPVSIIDAIFTLQGVMLYGPEAEMNPIGRFLLGLGYWPLWVALNVVGFSLFCMLVGSYYLHTRDTRDGPDTTFLSIILAIRVGMAAYNVAYFYIVSVAAAYPPFWISILSVGISALIFNRILTLRHDISWWRTKLYFRNKLDNFRDRRLIKSSVGGKTALEDKQQETLLSELPKSSTRGLWLKRSAYFLGVVVILIAVLFSAEVILVTSGLYGVQSDNMFIALVTQSSGILFLLGFVIVLVFIGVSAYLITKAFNVTEEMRV